MTATAIDHRTDAEVLADVARRRHLRILGEAADAYEHQASVLENCGGSVANVDRLKDRAHAVRRVCARVTELEAVLEDIVRGSPRCSTPSQLLARAIDLARAALAKGAA